MVKTCSKENYIKLVLYWTQHPESTWFNSQSKQVCLHHQHQLLQNCCVYIQTKQLSVTNCKTLIKKHDLMLQSCTFTSAWWEIDPTLVLDEAGFHLTGYINSQNNRYQSVETLILIHEVPLYDSTVCVWCAKSARGELELVFVIWVFTYTSICWTHSNTIFWSPVQLQENLL